MSAYSDDVVARLRDAASVFEERSAVYKDNVHMVGKVMEALFPEGHTQLSQQDHNRWHIFELMIVKVTRYVLNYDSGGHEDSLTDLAVYATMLNALDQERATLGQRDAEEAFKAGPGKILLVPNDAPRYPVTVLGPGDDPHEGQDFDWPHRDATGHGPGSTVPQTQALWMFQDAEGKSDGQRYCWTCARKVHEFYENGAVFYLHDVQKTERVRNYGHGAGQEPPTPSMVTWHGPSGSAYCNNCGHALKTTGEGSEMVHTSEMHPHSPLTRQPNDPSRQ